MNESTLFIFSAMLAVATIICLGAMARKLDWLTREADKSLLNLTIRVLVPCLIFDVIVGNPKLQSASNVIYPPLAGFCLGAGGMLVAWLIARLFGKYVGLISPTSQRTFAFSAGIANYGFIPIPLTDVLFRDQPLVRDATMGVLLVHNSGVDFAVWTVGIIILTGSVGRDWWKRVVNPVSITIVISLLINALGWDMLGPESMRQGLRQAVHLVGGASVPLSLILVGASVADFLPSLQVRKSLGTIGLGVATRMGLLACVFIAVAWALPVSDELKRVLVIQGAMPSAMAPIILARHYEGDPSTALCVALGTTFVALLTTPLWLHAGLQWVGLGL